MRFDTKLHYYNMHLVRTLKGLERVEINVLRWNGLQELGDESVKTAKDTEVDNDEDVIKANKLTALKRHTAGLDQGPGSCNSSPVSNGATQQACHGEHEGRGQE